MEKSIRADFDAVLCSDGKARHLCGHDGHSACLAGLALETFVSPEVHSKGIGYSAWCKVEEMYPEIEIWETCTPYFEKRNIHFYVNRCGFHIVEFFNSKHPDPNENDESKIDDFDGMFRFEKVMRV